MKPGGIILGLCTILFFTQCQSGKERVSESIFNGEDLSGWSSPDMSYWSVSDSAIVGGVNKSSIEGNQFLWHKTKVADFYLKVEVKLVPNTANAGIQFRSSRKGSEAHGYQADAGRGMWGRLYHESGRGQLDWRGAGEAAIVPNQWNTYEILAVGHRIWTAINGKLSVSFRDIEGEQEGYIALQIHSGPAQTVRYKPIEMIHNPSIELAGMNEEQLNETLTEPSAARLNERPHNKVYGTFTNQKFNIIDDEVIAFVGQTNMVHEQYHGHLEARLVAQHPNKNIACRNIAWEGDTVYEQWRDLNFGTWQEQLRWINASMIIAQYGQTEAMDGLEKLPAFIRAYESLLKKFSSRTNRMVLISPMPFEAPPGPHHRDLTALNDVVEAYAKAIKDMTDKQGYIFVDLFSELKNYNSERLTTNGMHLNARGQKIVGEIVSRALLSEEVNTGENFTALREEIIEKNRIWFNEWRPMNWSFSYGDRTSQPFGKPGAQGEPSLEAELKNYVPIMDQMDNRVQAIAMGKTPKPLSLPKITRSDSKKKALSPEEEKASFTIRDGFDINLFASEKDGVINPLKMTWDEKGRLWVACSPSYPHIVPGAKNNDYVLICEDTDNDGSADKFIKFAEGLFMPMGIEFGDGGVYICEGTQIIHLTDTDGDNKADKKRVVLSGFGTGDSHQKVNSIRYGPGGEMWFTQGHHAYSIIETPYGIKRLDKSSVWRFRPRTGQLHGFFNNSTAGSNNWGVNYDSWGQLFHNSGADKAYYTVPGTVPTSHPLFYNNVSPLFRSRVKTTGLEFIETSHMPRDLQNAVITSDFMANKVELFRFFDESAGFRSEPLTNPLLVSSSRREFRVVDVSTGPDGAIYLCDWYNPVIGHYQASYSDPERDYSHGRIWRMTARDRPTVTPPPLETMSIAQLLEQLKHEERWVRYQAKRLLFNRPSEEVLKEADKWVSKLHPGVPGYEQLMYRVMGIYESHEVARPQLLEKMLQAKKFQTRAYAARVIGHLAGKLDNPLELLERCINDPHPRVRLEAVISCSYITSGEALEVAMEALENSDKFINYSLTQTVHTLLPYWQPAFEKGELNFSNNVDQLVYVFKISESEKSLDKIRQLVEQPGISNENYYDLIGLMAEMGNAEDLRYILDHTHHEKILVAIENAAKIRGIKPTGELTRDVREMLDHSDNGIRIMGFRLVAAWDLLSMWDDVVSYALSGDNTDIRTSAINSMVNLDNSKSIPVLEKILNSGTDMEIKKAALGNLSNHDMKKATDYTVEFMLSEDLDKNTLSGIILPVLKKNRGSKILAEALSDKFLSQNTKNMVLGIIASSGIQAPEITNLFTGINDDAIGMPVYSEELVEKLVAETGESGDYERGKTVYNEVTVSCASCHKIGEKGSDIGPDLSALGSSMPTDAIIEALIWPQRDIKEGFLSTTITTRDNTVIRGYVREKDNNTLKILDLTTREIKEVHEDNIASREDSGSAMPNGVVANISKQQLLDLIKYLEGLRR